MIGDTYTVASKKAAPEGFELDRDEYYLVEERDLRITFVWHESLSPHDLDGGEGPTVKGRVRGWLLREPERDRADSGWDPVVDLSGEGILLRASTILENHRRDLLAGSPFGGPPGTWFSYRITEEATR